MTQHVSSDRTAASVELRGIVKRFGSAVAVDGVNLTIGEGEFISLLGPSGCGKRPRAERLDHGPLVHDRPARSVDQHRTRFEQCELTSAQEATGLLRQTQDRRRRGRPCSGGRRFPPGVRSTCEHGVQERASTHEESGVAHRWRMSA